MKVSEIIGMLTANYKPDDEILAAWWDREWFEEYATGKLTDDKWDHVLLDAENAWEALSTIVSDTLIAATEGDK